MSPVLPLAATLVARWTAADYLTNAELGFAGLQGWYNETSGLWDTCGWWNGANALTAIGDLAKQPNNNVTSQVTSVMSNTYGVTSAYNPQPLEPGNHNSADPIAWCDHCYDDNGWWAHAWINAYDVTGNQAYLDLAKGIFDQNTVKSGPSNCTVDGIVGGSYWCDNNPYVNAIANELYLSTAAHLANRVDASDKAYYVEQAQNQWNWFAVSGLINPQNLINDGLEANCTNTYKRTIWSYNQGVILGGLVELNRAAPNQSLIDSANTLAEASIGYLCDSNHIVHDTCEPDCAPDATQFKGIYIRNLVMLNAVSPSSLYQTVLTANAASIWDNDRLTNNNTFGVNWAELVEGTVVRNGIVQGYTDASTSGSALDGLIGGIGAA